MYREMPKLNPEEILVYLRKSRSDDPMLSVEEVLQRHETILNEWIERNLDAQIPEENWYREVVSGETIANRPEMRKVLRKIESSQYKAVLCVECSRLSRGDLEDCGRLMKILRFSSTYVITPMKMYDLADEYDRDGFERELKRGNDYLEYTKKVLYTGRELSAKKGFFLGATPPYGYNRIWIMDGKRKRPSLEINEHEAEVVRIIYDMYLNQGIGVQAIATKIGKMGIVARNGLPFSRSTVRDILRNEHLMGKVVWKRRPITKIVEQSEIITKRDVNEDRLLFDGMHPAIISEEVFYKAQEITNSMPKVNIDFTLKNPLSTILYCTCGNIMTLNGSSVRKPRYRCKYHTTCKNASIETSEVIEAVCKAIEEEIDNFEVRLNQSEKDEQKRKISEIKVVEKRIVECENKEVSLWEKYTEEGMPKRIFDQLLEKNTSEKERLLNELKSLKDTINTHTNCEDAITTLSEALEALRNREASAEKQNALLKACIDKITYSRESPIRVTKDYNGPTKNGWTVPDFHLHIDFKI